MVTLLGVADDHELLADIAAPVDGNHQLADVLLDGVGRPGDEDRGLCRGETSGKGTPLEHTHPGDL